MKLKKLVSLALAATLAVSSLFALSSCGGEKNNKLPIVCGESGMTSVAGVATYGVDYYNLGVKAGDIAADILLDGKKASEIPVATDPNPALMISEAVAEEIGFTIPDSVKSKATGGETQKVTRKDSAVIEETDSAEADYTVGILQLVQHVALDQSNVGFIDQLSVRMDAAGKTVKVLDKNAAGDESNNTTIADNFVAQNVDLIYAIATSSSQAAANAASESDIPVIFNAVTNPVDAGLVNDMNAPGKNVTGVSDINPVSDQIDLIGELLGKDDVKIGLLYTSSETNSVFQIELAKARCEAKGYSYVDGSIVDINDLENAMIKLQNEGVDAIYIPTDNTLANGISTVHSLNKGE